MTPGHSDLRESLGAYVLGALDPADRRRLEQHLSECVDCTDELTGFSALPGLLGRVTEDEAASDLLVPTDDLLDGIIGRLADDGRMLRRRLERWRIAAVAAGLVALAALAGLGITVLPGDPPPDRLVVAAASETSGASGEAAAIAWEWGTTVDLDVAGLPPRDGYVLWAMSEDGRRERAGTWGTTASNSARVRGASSIPRSQLQRVEVTDRTGRVIMSFDFSSAQTA